MHARPPKHLEERFDWYADAIESSPEAAKGAWRSRRMPAATKVHLDLGCGKGTWTCGTAKLHPDELYIGFDNETICIAMAAKKAVVEDRIPNVVFALTDAAHMDETIGDGEIDVLHLNFSTPLPRAKFAPKRLTHALRLDSYRRILAPTGRIELKTDSQPFFDWTLRQMEAAGWQVDWLTRDLHAETAPQLEHNVLSGYEARLMEKGARIHALIATPGPRPAVISQDGIPASLMDYLPDDLWSLDYIPYGMEEAVTNFRNRRAKEQARAKRKSTEG